MQIKDAKINSNVIVDLSSSDIVFYYEWCKVVEFLIKYFKEVINSWILLNLHAAYFKSKGQNDEIKESNEGQSNVKEITKKDDDEKEEKTNQS